MLRHNAHSDRKLGVYNEAIRRKTKIFTKSDLARWRVWGLQPSAERKRWERTLVSVIDCIEREFLKFRWTARRRRYARASPSSSKAGSDGMCGERFSNAFSLSKKGATKSAPAAIQAIHSGARMHMQLNIN